MYIQYVYTVYDEAVLHPPMSGGTSEDESALPQNGETMFLKGRDAGQINMYLLQIFSIQGMNLCEFVSEDAISHCTFD